MLKEKSVKCLADKGQEASAPLLLPRGAASSATAAMLAPPLTAARRKAQAASVSIANVVQPLWGEGI